ncbi:MAG: NAD(P)/FAD-dependent oxidoreductase [Fimbriimonadaceae bacterium]|nr:NAD(P)/FAD-dependent oxidoreductase [Fimbriimonadaceae bacterium]
MDGAHKPMVVVIGGGFGGLATVKALGRAPVEVTLIDRQNHHLFQPLLYQVATAGLSATNIAWPIRSLLRSQRNARVLMAEVRSVDPIKRVIFHDHGFLAYDHLVLATGVTHSYFGHDHWEPFAPGLKTLQDAAEIRSRVLSAFEQAEATPNPLERRRLLSIVIVGGGPTGVELAGSIAELARRTLARDFRKIDPADARIVLIEAEDHLLASFDPGLREYARRTLVRLGVEVQNGVRVNDVRVDGVETSSGFIPSRTVLWAAGVRATPAGEWLGADVDRMGRLVVDDHCRVPRLDNVYAIGDLAHFIGSDGKPLPGVAQVAMQQGAYVGRQIADSVTGESATARFVYKNLGNMATIGRRAAVAEFGHARFAGFPAWLVWLFVHLMSLVAFRSRVTALVEWVAAYVTYERGARVISARDETADRESATRPTPKPPTRT